MNESCHKYKRVETLQMSPVTHTHTQALRNEIIVQFLQLWVKVHESCHTHRGVMSHRQRSHVTHTEESCHTETEESCHTDRGVMSHTPRSHVIQAKVSSHKHQDIMPHTQRSHLTNIDESCHTHTNTRLWKCDHWVAVSAPLRRGVWVMSHMYRNHVTNKKKSWHKYEWVMSHTHTRTRP